MQTDTLYEILQCPDCGGKIDKRLQCALCERNFETKNDIAFLLPLRDLPVLSLYDDINYRKYHAILAQAHDYFYDNPNPIIRWVQHSFYQSIVKYIQNKEHRILETGCGTGKVFTLNHRINRSRYVLMDIDLPSLELVENKTNFNGVLQGTAYKLPFCSSIFDRVISCAQLEHLCYLDVALQEIVRVLKPDGEFIASIPTEGGFLWSFGRRLTSAPHFGKNLGIDYIKANRIDHFNTIHQIDRALRRHFTIKKRVFFPLQLPSFDYNATCTYILKPLKNPD